MNRFTAWRATPLLLLATVVQGQHSMPVSRVVTRVTAAPAAPADDRWLVVDAPQRRARIVVRAGVAQASQPELNFNGTSMGELEFRVPLGWLVELDFSNVGQAVHSVRVVRDVEVPVQVGPAVIAGAESPRAERGLAPGSTHTVRFRAARAGRYRVACAVPAHGYAGMWMHLTVDPALTRPEVVAHPDGADAVPVRR